MSTGSSLAATPDPSSLRDQPIVAPNSRPSGDDKPALAPDAHPVIAPTAERNSDDRQHDQNRDPKANSVIAAIAHHDSLRSALDAALYAWAAAEVVLRLANRNAERGTDWTFIVVVGSVIAGINLGLRADHDSAYAIGSPLVFGSIGVALVIAGAAFRIWSILTLGRLFTFVVTVQRDHQLVDRGPYRILRHPSYTGGLIGLAGAGIALDNWLSVAALLLIPLVGVLVRIPVEEARLVQGLGHRYREYASKTWRLVPHLW
jgi:protein-S-isoprenylcysteine O-methyltransferase Ste14